MYFTPCLVGRAEVGDHKKKLKIDRSGSGCTYNVTRLACCCTQGASEGDRGTRGQVEAAVGGGWGEVPPPRCWLLNVSQQSEWQARGEAPVRDQPAHAREGTLCSSSFTPSVPQSLLTPSSSATSFTGSQQNLLLSSCCPVIRVRVAMVTVIFSLSSFLYSLFSHCVLYQQSPTPIIFCCSPFSSHSFQVSRCPPITFSIFFTSYFLPLSGHLLSLPIFHIPVFFIFQPISS